jgi:hypothetical protein
MPIVNLSRSSARTLSDPFALRTFYRFHFHARLGTRPATARTALFSSPAVFQAQLANWNRCGWSYYVDPDDEKANAAVVAVRCYGADHANSHTESAWDGPAQHHHLFAITQTNADEVAALFGVRPCEAGFYDPSASFRD